MLGHLKLEFFSEVAIRNVKINAKNEPALDRAVTQQWWTCDNDAVARGLVTDLNRGLSSAECARRLETYGFNKLREAKAQSPWRILFDQFRNFIVWVLIAAVLISGLMREWVDAIAIMAIVVLNAVLGFIQEYRAEKSLAALRKLGSPTSRVVRNGIREVIPAEQLVPGDLVELEHGDNIPADARLVMVTPGFTVQEASLTGESLPVAKNIAAIARPDVPLGDRLNMVFMGTSIASGKARAVVVDTGMGTELGRIAGMLQQIKREQTPLQRKLEQFGKWIVGLCLGLVSVIFFLGVLRGGELFEMFLTAVSLAVAAIPEGLPAVVTIALTLGVHRMVKRHVLVRKLNAVETLGCTTVICSDKTGTLTRNEMTVQTVFAGGLLFDVTGVGYDPHGSFMLDGKPVETHTSSELMEALRCGVLCNGAQLLARDGVHQIIGDPTEGAILTVAAKAGLLKGKLEDEFPVIEELPFDSIRKKMTILRRKDQRVLAFVKGAPDVLLGDCIAIAQNGGTRSLNDADRRAIADRNNELTARAMRVLAVAYRVMDSVPDKFEAKEIEKDLVFLGLIAMIDPPREEVKKSINLCMRAGIKAVMITGDHKNTAVAVAREIGTFTAGSIALSGTELDALTDEQLGKEVERVSVYARVSPEHKLKIIRAWRKRGAVVAMTGDGVNDAPAVKEADIGVAMGITGTDVTKEVSDMVITDDNFSSIVAAVEEGRSIYDNIRKFIHYLLSCNTSEVLVMFIASLLGWPLPLLPIHLLWINLVTDGFPALALGVEPPERNVMRRSPRKPKEAVVTMRRALLMIGQGALIALCTMAAFHYGLGKENNLVRARTMGFMVLAFSQLFHAFNCRNLKESIFRIGLFTNAKLIIAVLFSFLLQMAALGLPLMQRVFKTESLELREFMLLLLLASFPLWIMELAKFIYRRWPRK